MPWIRTAIIFTALLIVNTVPSCDALLFQRLKGVISQVNRNVGITLVITTFGVQSIVLPPQPVAAEVSLIDRIKIEFDERDMNGKKDTQYRAVKPLQYSKTLVINKDQELIDNILAIKKASR